MQVMQKAFRTEPLSQSRRNGPHKGQRLTCLLSDLESGILEAQELTALVGRVV